MISRRMVVLAALAASPATLQAAEDTPAARFAAIEAAQRAARDGYTKELQQLEPDGAASRAATDRFLAKLGENVEAAFALARQTPGDPVSFEALKFVIRTNRAGPGDATARALRLILDRDDDRRPGQGDYLPHVALPLFQYPEAEALLRRVLDRNPRREDRAAACYWLAHHLSQQARMVRRLRDRPGDLREYDRYVAARPIDEFVREKDPDALDAAAEALLGRCVGEFGDIPFGQPLGLLAGNELFAMRHLVPGKVAPEIDGLDHEGRRFKLSESRGKVVMLTFSGNWCGPCVAMYPQERALLAKLEGKPFAMLSVDTDEKVETLGKAIASGEITWRCWWDGGTEGPITSRWGINSFPSIFVLDRRGVIRFKGLRGDDLERAVAGLLDEREEADAPK